jgi:hypothetical protein
VRFNAIPSEIKKPQYSPSNTLHIPRPLVYNYSKQSVEEHPKNINEKIKLVFMTW